MISKDELIQIMHQSAPNAVFRGEVDASIPLSNIGLDSLDTMSFLLMLQEKLGFEIPDSDIDALETLNDIYAYCNNHVNKNVNNDN